MVLPLLLMFASELFAIEPPDESLGYVRVNRNSGICTFYLKEGKSGKLVPITNESRTTTAPNFGTIKYKGEAFKTTSSRFRLDVRNIENGFIIERKSTFVSFEEEITVVNQVTGSGIQRFFKVKLTVKNLRPVPAKIELRYVFDSFSKNSREAILLNQDMIVKESLRVEDFSAIRDVGYVTDFNMKPIWFTPEEKTRNEVDFIVISNWKKLHSTPWFSQTLLTGDFFSYPESRADTALAFYFKEVSLNENESVSYSFQLDGGNLSSRVREDLMQNKKGQVEYEDSTVVGKKDGDGRKAVVGEITVTEKIIDSLLREIDEQMLRVDSLSPEELANLTGKVETLERYKEAYEKAKR